jgi:hypothetical protein
MRCETYRQNPLECSEIPRVRPAPPGRRAGEEVAQVVLVTEMAGIATCAVLSFKVLTSLLAWGQGRF